MMKNSEIALIFGNYVNGHTIVRSLERIGFDGEVVIVREDCDPVLLSERLDTRCGKWVVSKEESSELTSAILMRWPDAERIHLFFTSERYHRVFAGGDRGLGLGGVDQSREPRAGDRLNVHFGDTEQIGTILDRFRLYEFIAGRNLANVPETIGGDEDPFASFGDSFVVRPRETWRNPRQRESVKIVRGREDFEAVMRDFASRNVGAEVLCFQELLSIRDEENVSVCGWFDAEHRHLYCLRKRIQHPPSAGNGVVCECIEAPEGVMEATVSILEALRYDGPLELEFVLDAQRGEFKVIEMNPRFWMQHGLVEQLSGHALVSRNLGRNPMTPTRSESAIRYWVNPLSALLRAVRFDFRALGYCLRRDGWLPYSLLYALWYAPMHVLAKRRRGNE